MTLLIVFLFLSSLNLYAESIKETKTNPIVVTANCEPILYSETARVVTVISPEQIRNSNAKNIEELLKYISNVDVRRRGGPQAQVDFSIRGGTFEQTLILINGIPFNSAQTGHHNGNLPISIYDIERIEILEGSGSRVLGTNAFSGGINIITKSPNKSKKINLALSGGEYGFYDLNISSSNELFKNFRTFYSIYKQKSDGYIKNTDTDLLNFYGNNNLQTEYGNFNLQFGANNRKFGANSFYTAKYPNQFEAINSSFVNFAYDNVINDFIINTNFYYKSLFDKFELFRSMKDAPSWYAGHNYHQNDAYGGQFKISYNSNIGASSLGFELKREEILSNVLGKKLAQPKKIPNVKDKYFIYKDSRDNISLYAEQTLRFYRFFVAFGGMFNFNSNFDNDVYGGIDVSYKINDNLNVFMSANQSGRLPSFTDLYYQGPTNKGNPYLKPEHSLSLETGLKIYDNFHQTSFSIFRNYGKDLIDWIKHPDSTLWETKNLTELNTIGFQFSTKVYPELIFHSYKWFKFFHFSYTYMASTKSSENYQSLYALDYLKHKISAGVNVEFLNGFNFDLSATYHKRSGTYFNYTKNQEIPFEKVILIGSRLSYKYSNIMLFIDIDNILNKKYQDIGNVTQPGRWARGGIILNI